MRPSSCQHRDGATLKVGQDLKPEQRHYSPHHAFFCVYQRDCNFVVYRTSDGQAVWASHPRHAMFSRLPLKLSMQHDRNLVTYAGVQNSQFSMMEAGWASNTCGRGVPGGGVILDDDGRLRIHDGSDTLLWTS